MSLYAVINGIYRSKNNKKISEINKNTKTKPIKLIKHGLDELRFSSKAPLFFFMRRFSKN